MHNRKLALIAAALSTAIYSTSVKAADIVDTAVSAGSFNTLVAAVQAAGLEDVLRSAGPFTVFAPTDEAFAKLPQGTVESLLKPENKDKLIGILTYHVDDRRLTSNMLPAGPIHVKPVNTANRLAISKSGHSVTVNQASVLSADIMADNGVIHVIDEVLIPAN